jgi:hypothetical protein
VRLFVDYFRQNFAAAFFGVLRADTASGVAEAQAKLLNVLKVGGMGVGAGWVYW